MLDKLVLYLTPYDECLSISEMRVGTDIYL